MQGILERNQEHDMGKHVAKDCIDESLWWAMVLDEFHKLFTRCVSSQVAT